MNGWGDCMQTMLKTVRAHVLQHLCSHLWPQVFTERLSDMRVLCSPALTCPSLDAGVGMEAAQAQEGPGGGKLVRRGNAHFKGQE